MAHIKINVASGGIEHGTMTLPQLLGSAFGPGVSGQPLTSAGGAADPSFASTGLKIDSCYGAITADTQSAGTWTVNLATSNWHTATLTASITTLTLVGGTIGQQFTLVIIQGGTGSYTMTWPTTTKWAAGSAPTLTTTVGGIDVISIKSVSSGVYYGFVIGLAMA